MIHSKGSKYSARFRPLLIFRQRVWLRAVTVAAAGDCSHVLRLPEEAHTNTGHCTRVNMEHLEAGICVMSRLQPTYPGPDENLVLSS